MCNLTGGSFQPALALLWSRQSGHTALLITPLPKRPKTFDLSMCYHVNAWEHNFDHMVPGFASISSVYPADD